MLDLQSIKTTVQRYLEDLWTREDFRGRTGMYTITNSAGYMFVLMTARTFFGSEYEVDKALDKIKELRPFNQVGFSGTMETVLTRGEVSVAPLDFAAVARLKAKEVKLDISPPSEGMFMWEQVFNVLKGSKKKELGYQWIDHILDPETQQKWVENYYWSPVNKNVEIAGALRSSSPSMARRWIRSCSGTGRPRTGTGITSSIAGTRRCADLLLCSRGRPAP